MSLPLPFPSTDPADNDSKENLSESFQSIQHQFLSPEERWDVYQVKGAERPHLLSYTEPKEQMQDSLEDQIEEPLIDGCDIPGWRKEGMEKIFDVSSDAYALFHIGSESAARYMRRCSQWPISPSYKHSISQFTKKKKKNKENNICTQNLLNIHTSPWSQLRDKLSLSPKQGYNCKCIEYKDYCKEDAPIQPQPRSASQKLKRTIFAKQFEERNIPAKIMNATHGWKAMPDKINQNKGWEFQDFVQRFQYIKWRFSDVHGEMMEMGTYQKYIFAEGSWDDSPLGIYDSEFGDDDATKILLEEYSVPDCFSPDLFEMLPEQTNHVNSDDQASCSTTSISSTSITRPPYRWILIGPPRSGTGLHIDPLWTNAWVTLLQGTKRWMLFPPTTPPEQVGMIEGSPQIPSSIWFRDYYDKVMDESTWPKEWKPVEVLQKPGETVFVPNGWMHLVLNLDLAVAVTHNYASEFGPFERMWQEVVTEEPDFALPWFQGMVLQRPDLAKRAYDFHIKNSNENWTKNIELPLEYSLQNCSILNDAMEEKKVD